VKKLANWGQKFSKVTQAAISKSKEMAEITRLNMEISADTQKLREIYEQIGKYIAEQDLLTENETVSGWKEDVTKIQSRIDNNQQKVNEVKNVNICPNCGGEVSRSNKFCDQCGMEMKREVLEKSDSINICKNCGEPLSDGAVFCASCGSKQEQE